MLLAVSRSLTVLSESPQRVIEALRSGTWKDHPYYLLEGAREKSLCYYRSRVMKIALALVIIMYFASSASLSDTFERLHVISHEYSCDHPVVKLAYDAQKSFNATRDAQSQSLEEAVAEYRRRYQMPPPPLFDKWYEFATARDTIMIDEFDTIYHAILPFWGLAPSTIRARVREDLGKPNAQMEVTIRNGRPIHKNGGQLQFQKPGTIESLEKFAQWLPDMNLGFNTHDEPRVTVPHDALSQLVLEGRKAHARLNDKRATLRSYFTHQTLEAPIPVYSTRFMDIDGQESWLYSRLSCPLDSPARALNDDAEDDSTKWALKPLGFIYNQTAASDICLNPSLRHRSGVFEHPNAFKITNQLTPMFSMSRPSSFQDIAVPSPYYRVSDTDFTDVTPESTVRWEDKIHQLYWRGSTKGGHSHGGSWRNLFRQRVIGNLTHPQSPQYVMKRQEISRCNVGADDGWTTRSVTHDEIKDYFNTHFTSFQDCHDDCDEEEMFFNGTVELDPQEEAWKYRYLLDIDGHAYSGRFYSFMRSQSVPFKLTIFREWHDNVLFPWVHYVPINRDVTDIPELIRFFEHDPAGERIARSIALEGQEWAQKALRNEDLDVYLFRLLLEYVGASTGY